MNDDNESEVKVEVGFIDEEFNHIENYEVYKKIILSSKVVDFSHEDNVSEYNTFLFSDFLYITYWRHADETDEERKKSFTMSIKKDGKKRISIGEFKDSDSLINFLKYIAIREIFNKNITNKLIDLFESVKKEE